LREITEANFQEFIQDQPAVITFSSPWCASCKKIARSLEGLSLEFDARVLFGICDISAHPSIAATLQVFSVPSVLIFQKGAVVKRFQGVVSDAAILQTLKECL